MDKAALVDFDIKIGSDIVGILDKAKVRLNVALWAFLSDYEDWRLVLAGRPLDTLGLFDAYGLIHDTLAATGIRPSQTPPLMIYRMAEPFIVDLRRFVRKRGNYDGMRLGGQVLGNKYLADA